MSPIDQLIFGRRARSKAPRFHVSIDVNIAPHKFLFQNAAAAGSAHLCYAGFTSLRRCANHMRRNWVTRTLYISLQQNSQIIQNDEIKLRKFEMS